MNETVPGFLEWLPAGSGRVPRISSALLLPDRIGAWKSRWGIGRMNYIVPPGLYAVGYPGAEDPVVVTANYKMSYDIIRQTLAGRNVWLLVLETYGINVWCAAGKGTFGTEELVRRIAASGLSRIVSHRQLILPILGAPGVAAHEVARRSGFKVNYAAIRAEDLPRYLDNGRSTTDDMRELTFTFRERLILLPVEILIALRSAGVLGLLVFLVTAATAGMSAGIQALLAGAGAAVAGVILAPLLLPWIPGRSFALKGALTGAVWSVVWLRYGGGSEWDLCSSAAALLAMPALSAYYTLGFTGCSPFPSRTGVKKEMHIALPLIGCAAAAAIMLIIAGHFF